jgi:hypothetical protein
VGEVIGAAIILVAVVFLVAGGITIVVRQTRPDPNAVNSPQYRNHIETDDRNRGRHLLAEFYDERPGRSAK